MEIGLNSQSIRIVGNSDVIKKTSMACNGFFQLTKKRRRLGSAIRK